MPDYNIDVTNPFESRVSRWGDRNHSHEEALQPDSQPKRARLLEELVAFDNLQGGTLDSEKHVQKREGVRYPTEKVKSYRSELRPTLWQETLWLGSFKSEEAAMKAFDAALFYTGKSPVHFIYPLDYFPALPTSFPDVRKREVLLRHVRNLARDISGKRNEFKSILIKLVKEAAKRTTPLQAQNEDAKVEDITCTVPVVTGLRQFRPAPEVRKFEEPLFSVQDVKVKVEQSCEETGDLDYVQQWLKDMSDIRPDITGWLPTPDELVPTLTSPTSPTSTGECPPEDPRDFLRGSTDAAVDSSATSTMSFNSAQCSHFVDVGEDSCELDLISLRVCQREVDQGSGGEEGIPMSSSQRSATENFQPLLVGGSRPTHVHQGASCFSSLESGTSFDGFVLGVDMQTGKSRETPSFQSSMDAISCTKDELMFLQEILSSEEDNRCF